MSEIPLRYWIIEERDLRAALARAAEAEDIDMVLLEALANAKTEPVEGPE